MTRYDAIKRIINDPDAAAVLSGDCLPVQESGHLRALSFGLALGAEGGCGRMTPEERARTICDEFRDAVCVLMRRQNRTQEDVAYTAGISPEHLCRMLRGRESIKILTICRMADALGYDVKLKLIRKEDRENDQSRMDRHPQ